MLPLTLEALAILLVAIVPGYIAVTLWSRTKTWERPSTDLTLIVTAVIFSAVIQVLLSWLTIPWLWPIRTDLIDHAGRVAWWAFFVVIVLPALGGIYVGRFSDYLARTRTIPTSVSEWMADLFSWRRLFPPTPPTAWDMFFLRRIPRNRCLIVTFEDGTAVAGSYYEPSFAATSPQQPGIYLNRQWTLDANGQLGRPVPRSRGLLVPTTANIKHIRVVERPSPQQLREHQ